MKNRKSFEMQSTTAEDIVEILMSMKDERKRAVYMHFFKTGKGDYGEGDRFLGIVNPKVRSVVKEVDSMELPEIHKLLMSPWHEVRLTGFLILVDRFEKLSKKRLSGNLEAIKSRDEIVKFYLDHAERANNWDLVDLSVIKIIGTWLCLPTFLGSTDGEPGFNFDHKMEVLDSLADSTNLWKQRMSVVCTWKTSQAGDAVWCLKYSLKHLHHSHDLMHKAVGWMLREMGKGCGMDVLREFLDGHIHEMSRTTLRYAIEKMPEDERQMWLKR
jgi:Predicted DNA alkylation repair enzyme